MASQKYKKHPSWARPAVVGFLGATTPTVWSAFVAAFEQRLRELGWINGHNIEINYQWAEGRPDRYAKIAEDFARRGVDIIVTAGTPAVLAAKRTTKVIPIVFAAAGDPVRTKLVASLKRPGGNVTGLSNGQTDLAGKRLDKLRAAVPALKRLGIIGNGASKNVQLEIDGVQRRAKQLGMQTVVRDVRRATKIAPAIKGLKGKADALYICTDPLVTHHGIHINTLAASAGLPTMHAFRDYVETGGLLSYGPDFRALFARAADLTDKVLRGTKPADIPVKQEKKCEFVLNLNTAKALGLKIPRRVRGSAEAIR